MGLFSKLFGGSKTDGSVETGPRGPSSLPAPVVRLMKKVENKYGQSQDRQAAIRQLADMGTPEGVHGMLRRFTFRIEQSIGDEEEKRQVYDELLRLGPVSVAPILAFLEAENAPYWPTKALCEIIGEESTVARLIEIIERAEAIFDRDIERKVELVSNLREYKDPRVRDLLMGFLSAENEELRVHAIEGLAELGREEMGDLMVERLLDDNETQRVKTAVLNLLIEKKWKVKHHKESIRKVIPAAFWIDDVGVIHRR
jgi:HEAT repeat protein